MQDGTGLWNELLNALPGPLLDFGYGTSYNGIHRSIIRSKKQNWRNMMTKSVIPCGTNLPTRIGREDHADQDQNNGRKRREAAVFGKNP